MFYLYVSLCAFAGTLSAVGVGVALDKAVAYYKKSQSWKRQLDEIRKLP